MLRSMMQVYVTASVQAVELYIRAFDATLSNEYKDEEGNYIHAEINAFGQVIAISEGDTKAVSCSTMQFCLHFDEEEIDKVKKAYEVLKEGAEISNPIGECFYSKCMFSLIDKFGVNWCLFI